MKYNIRSYFDTTDHIVQIYCKQFSTRNSFTLVYFEKPVEILWVLNTHFIWSFNIFLYSSIIGESTMHSSDVQTLSLVSFLRSCITHNNLTKLPQINRHHITLDNFCRLIWSTPHIYIFVYHFQDREHFHFLIST